MCWSSQTWAMLAHPGLAECADDEVADGGEAGVQVLAQHSTAQASDQRTVGNLRSMTVLDQAWVQLAGGPAVGQITAIDPVMDGSQISYVPSPPRPDRRFYVRPSRRVATLRDRWHSPAWLVQGHPGPIGGDDGNCEKCEQRAEATGKRGRALRDGHGGSARSEPH
jgi:hypothetical protein